MNKGLRFECDEDLRLMQQTANGDSAAFDNLHEKYRLILKDYLAGFDLDHAARDDLAQEVFFRLWQNRTAFRNRSAFKTYLFGIANNVVQEHLRQIRREAVAGQYLRQASQQSRRQSEAQTVFDCQETAHAIEQAKSSLSDKQRQALELVFYSGMPHTEAAKKAGCSEIAFRRRFHDAKKRLREMLGDFRAFASRPVKFSGPER